MQDPIVKRNFDELKSKLFDVKFDLSNTDYEAIENIGSGAYGVVCSASDRRHPDRRVAIKKIPDIFGQTTIAMRTYREIRILKHFRHDNIISILDMLRPSDEELMTYRDVYIVLDLMESDLHRIIYSRQELTDEHVRYFLYQILRGLKYIHSANVVHRDLKPSNLLVNENCELKIGDFGMARGISSCPDSYNMKMTQYVATRWYRAPEIMLLSVNYTASIDVWSVGCILAEMLGRRQLFPGRDYRHQLELIFDVAGSPSRDYINMTSGMIHDFLCNFARKDPAILSEKFPKANQKAVRLIGNMLKLDPNDRISVEDALKDPYLSRYHDPDDEPICVPSFDFSFENEQLDSAALREVITKEILDYHRPKPLMIPASYSLVPVPSDQLMQVKPCVKQPSNDAQSLTTAVIVQPKERSAACSDLESVGIGVVDVTLNGVDSVKTNTGIEKVSIGVDVPVTDENCNVDMVSAGVQCQTEGCVNVDVAMLSARPAEDLNTSGTSELQASETDPTAPSAAKNTTANESEQSTMSDAKARIKAALLNAGRRKQQLELSDNKQISKGVTALQRQKEREEKRRLKMEKALEKKKKNRHKDNQTKGPTLTDEDRSMLERWEKMEKKVKTIQSSQSVLSEDSYSTSSCYATSDISNNCDSNSSCSSQSQNIPSSVSFGGQSDISQQFSQNISQEFHTLLNFTVDHGAEQPSMMVSLANTAIPCNGVPIVSRSTEPFGQHFNSFMSLLPSSSSVAPFTSYFANAPGANPVGYNEPRFASLIAPMAVGTCHQQMQQPVMNCQPRVPALPEIVLEQNHLPSYVEAVQAKSLTTGPHDSQNFSSCLSDSRSFQHGDGLLTQQSGLTGLDADWQFESKPVASDQQDFKHPSLLDLNSGTLSALSHFVGQIRYTDIPSHLSTSADSSFGSQNIPLLPADGLQIITSRLMKSHVDDLTLEHTPKGTGAGYGVGSPDVFQSLFTSDCGPPYDGPESAPLSATLLADWRAATGGMDASDLEAVLQAEFQMMGSPRINLNDLNNLT